MNSSKWLSTKLKYLICIFLGSISFIIFLRFQYYKVNDAPSKVEVDNLKVKSNNCCLSIEWRNPIIKNFTGTKLVISTNNYEKVVYLGKYESSYIFEEGKHGILYNVSIFVVLDDKILSDGTIQSAIFLNHDKLPDLPLIKIETIGGNEPKFEKVEPPENCVGLSISNNEYIPAIMNIESTNQTEFYSTINIRVRGNTSALTGKQPYKIHLDSSADLLNRNDSSYNNRNWILLKDATTLRTVVGMYVASLCGSEWQPEFRFVNLMLNGDWKGIYLLIESVDVAKKRVNISNSGFLIENDAYWWNNEEYFRSDFQPELLAYTFKYPLGIQLTEEKIYQIQNYINEFEYYLWNSDPLYANYIDISSWASWLLTQDILASYDGVGTNIYLYKYDFDINEPTSSKLKLGPAWDFDSTISKGTEEDWCGIRANGIWYFNSLIAQSDFKSVYITIWNTIYPSLQYVSA